MAQKGIDVVVDELRSRRDELLASLAVREPGAERCDERFEVLVDVVRRACSSAAERLKDEPRTRSEAREQAPGREGVARRASCERPQQAVPGPSTKPGDATKLLEHIRRGEVDALLGAGPLAGEVLVVKTLELEEENRRLIEALESEKQRLEEFAFATAHDLRGPLANIESEIATLLDQHARLRLPLWFVDSLRHIEHASVRMRLLVSDLLLLGEVGCDAEAPDDVRLFDVVASVLDGFRPALARRRVNVEVVDELPVVRGRPRQLEAIFSNLLDNAIRYAGAGAKGRVRIGCREDAGELVVWVRDNGPGFDAREAETVFQPYVRLDRSGDGTGLGLAIVRNAAESLGGRAWIETAPGRGATAFVALPAACVRPSHGASTARASEPPSPNEPT